MRSITRAVLAVTAAGAAFAIGSAPAVAQTPAMSYSGEGSVGITNRADCEILMRGYGYNVGPKVQQACATGASGGTWAFPSCLAQLVAIRVATSHAEAACIVAAA